MVRRTEPGGSMKKDIIIIIISNWRLLSQYTQTLRPTARWFCCVFSLCFLNLLSLKIEMEIKRATYCICSLSVLWEFTGKHCVGEYFSLSGCISCCSTLSTVYFCFSATETNKQTNNKKKQEWRVMCLGLVEQLKTEFLSRVRRTTELQQRKFVEAEPRSVKASVSLLVHENIIW